MSAAIATLTERAREDLMTLTGLELGSTLAAIKDEKGWRLRVEMVEKKSLPDSMDILATYEVLMDDEGNTLEFRRLRMRKRIDTETLEEEV